MNRLYKKSEIWFSVAWIIVYVVGASLADNLSVTLGVKKSITFPFLLVLSAVLAVWIFRNNLKGKYGLVKPNVGAEKFLYYIPLMVLASCNLWFGVRMNMSFAETLLYVGSMICVGFLEEVIFRGLLFKAMAKNNVSSAIIVSAATFGIGHIVNLFNGSGMDIVANVCQIIYAVAIGYLFVLIFYRSGSLLSCVITHSVLNSLSAFSNRPEGAVMDIAVSLALLAITLLYFLFLSKKLPKPNI